MGQLDSELSRLSLRLIEKESELHAKTAYCHQLELKLAKTHQDVKKIGDDYGARLKAHQIESSRQEAAILDPVALGDGVARVVILIQHLTFGHNLKFNELLLDIMRGTLLYVFVQATNSYLVHFLADHTFKYIG